MLAFVHIEKTAGSTMQFILGNSFGWTHCDTTRLKSNIFTAKDLDFAQKVFPAIKCVSGHNVVEPTYNLKGRADYFTILRDPITRTVSHYQDQVVRNKLKQEFKEWINNEDLHNLQVRRIAGCSDVDKAIKLLKEEYFFVGLMEEFDTSIKIFKILCPFDVNINYRKKIVAKDNTIRNLLLNDEAILKLLSDSNKLDIRLYKYVKEILFPAQKEKYDEKLKQMKDGYEKYKSSRTTKYQSSVIFNKFIFRQILKFRKTE